MSSLVIIRGQSAKLTPEQKVASAATAGIKFIRLRHNEWCEPNSNSRTTNGFQPVSVSVVVRGNKPERIVTWKKNERNEDCADHQLAFIGDDFGVGYAMLPDSPFNRRKLAMAELGENALWTIDDECIAAEIKQLSEQLRNDPAVVEANRQIEEARTQERIRRANAAKPGDKLEESSQQTTIEVLRNRIRELEGTRELEELRAKLKTLEEKSSYEKADKDAKDQKVDELREQIKAEVLAEKAELVARLREEKPNGWHLTGIYRTEIGAEIERRLLERLGR